MKVKTLTNELKALHALHELYELVNTFIQENGVEKIVSVSDSCTTGQGNTTGIIRVVAYEKA